MLNAARIALAVASLATMVIPAQACRVYRPPLTKQQAALAEYPRLGFVGRISTTFEGPRTKHTGQSIVQVEVTQDFSRKLPSMIYVFNPGCCVCVGIGGTPGDEVVSIVHRGDDGLFQLDY
jgi:hypothetical protein